MISIFFQSTYPEFLGVSHLIFSKVIMESFSRLLKWAGSSFCLFTVSYKPIRFLRTSIYLFNCSSFCLMNSCFSYYSVWELFSNSMRLYRFCMSELCFPNALITLPLRLGKFLNSFSSLFTCLSRSPKVTRLVDPALLEIFVTSLIRSFTFFASQLCWKLRSKIRRTRSFWFQPFLE